MSPFTTLPAEEPDELALRLTAERDRARETAEFHARALTEAEQHNSDLVKLCVALARLAGAVTPDEVAEALGDIVVNVVGSEEFAVFERGARTPLVSMGMDVPSLARLSAHLERSADTPGLITRLPLKVGAETVADLAIIGLLPHKGEMDESDRYLLDILSSVGGVALDGARLREAARPAAPAAA